MEGSIPELSRRGYLIATIKHHSHPGFEVDQPGKDSWRYSQAGYPSIEILRSEVGNELIGSSEQRFAVAADISMSIGVPLFDLGDIPGIAKLIEKRFLV